MHDSFDEDAIVRPYARAAMVIIAVFTAAVAFAASQREDQPPASPPFVEAPQAPSPQP